MTDLIAAGIKADDLIRTEVEIQDRMWGNANERADASKNQLLDAGISQLILTHVLLDGDTEGAAVGAASTFYPTDWSGLRSYGSPVANLVVAAAFIRSEIKRRLMAGEDTTRTKRGEPYCNPYPKVSSEQALADLTAERGEPIPHHQV